MMNNDLDEFVEKMTFGKAIVFILVFCVVYFGGTFWLMNR